VVHQFLTERRGANSFGRGWRALWKSLAKRFGASGFARSVGPVTSRERAGNEPETPAVELPKKAGRWALGNGAAPEY